MAFSPFLCFCFVLLLLLFFFPPFLFNFLPPPNFYANAMLVGLHFLASFMMFSPRLVAIFKLQPKSYRPHYQNSEGGMIVKLTSGGSVKLDSMWQHRLTRPLHVQHTYYRIIFKQNPFNIISRGVQGCTSTDFRLK